MSQIICHNKGRYNIYCTISDGFRFVSSLSLAQLKEVIIEDFDRAGLDELSERLERAHANGHSALSGESLDDFLICNRAGKGESYLTTEQCIEQFLS